MKLNNILSPEDYAETAVLQREVGEAILQRLDYMILKPQRIVNVGSRSGNISNLLSARYKNAELFSVDNSYSMLNYAKKNSESGFWIQANYYALPFKDHSVDFIFSNLVLPWCTDLESVLREWRRILRPEGLLLFTSLGPDTLRELPSEVNKPLCVDMHILGDLLTHTKWMDPVLDVDYFTVTYRERELLFSELQKSGMINFAGEISSVPLQKNAENVFPLTYEIIFGQAWGVGHEVDHVADEEGVVRIPLSHLRGRRGG